MCTGFSLFGYLAYVGCKFQNQANVHTLCEKSRLKHSAAILAAMKKRKKEHAIVLVWGDARVDQKPETFLFWPDVHMGLVFPVI